MRLALVSKVALDKDQNMANLERVTKKIEPIRSVTDSSGDDELTQFVCPACGYDYVHLGAVRETVGHEPGISDDVCPLGTRGGGYVLGLECEGCSEHWQLAIGFHKGQTLAGFVRGNGSQ